MTNFLKPNFESSINELEKNESQNLINYSGLGNEKIPEIVSKVYDSSNKVSLTGKVNATIDIQGDAPAGPLSGRGGSGQSGTATIDLVAGIGGATPIDIISGRPVQSVKSFEIDSARIYISAKTDIDEALGLPASKIQLQDNEITTQPSTGLSAIGIKSDVIRLVARDNIVITTLNSGVLSNNRSANPNGIDIIAGYYNRSNRTRLQPMVRGDSLANCLQDIINNVEELQDVVVKIKEEQMAINRFLLSHQHSMFTINVTYPPEGTESVTKNLTEIESLTSTFINKYIKFSKLQGDYLSITATDSIRSAYNRVN